MEDRGAGGVGARAFPLPLPLAGADTAAFEVGLDFLEGTLGTLSSILAFLNGRFDCVAEGAFFVVVEEGIARKAGLSAGLRS